VSYISGMIVLYSVSDNYRKFKVEDNMAKREILLLGNDNLYKVSEEITKDNLDKAKHVVADLHDTIDAFKEKYSYGRAIAAPQIDEAYRIIFMKYDDKILPFINPVMINTTDETFDLWDDCMSFPGLEVFVRRFAKIRVTYKDLDWKDQQLEFDGDLAELFQHEYDHLDGILAVQRALNNKAFRINASKVGKL